MPRRPKWSTPQIPGTVIPTLTTLRDAASQRGPRPTRRKKREAHLVAIVMMKGLLMPEFLKN